MALLNAGWWQTTWWPSQWWHEDWWPHYGAVAPSAPTLGIGGQVRVGGVPDYLVMLALVLIARRRRKRRITI